MKEFTVEVTRKVTTIETANISVKADNATEAKGVAKYRAERDNYEWTPGEDKIKVVSATIIIDKA